MKRYAVTSLATTNTRALDQMMGGACDFHVMRHEIKAIYRQLSEVLYLGHANVLAISMPYRGSCDVPACRRKATHTMFFAPIVPRQKTAGRQIGKLPQAR